MTPSNHTRNGTNSSLSDTNQGKKFQLQRCFFQIAGHKECFKVGTKPDTILKMATGMEKECLSELMKDKLSPFVPKIIGTVKQDGQLYLEMQDLLARFENASVMDIKMGCRTYGEEELGSALRDAKLRHDMYEKMVEVDANEPTSEERKVKAITKPRYMIWRETVSSTANLGFRIEGMRFRDGSVDKDFKTTKEEEQIAQALMRYTKSNKIRMKYLNRLYDLRQALMQSKFFGTHELIGSSLLFVHDDDAANVWLIDFAKTHLLPEKVQVNHKTKWELGNHEDGYLIGVDNLIRIFESIVTRTNVDNGYILQDRQTLQQQQLSQHQRVSKSKVDELHSATFTRVTSNTSKQVGLKDTSRFLPELKTW